MGASGDLADTTIRRLVDQGDEVRVLDPAGSARWKELGAHVARGDHDDSDVIERAGQNARTIVVFEPTPLVLTAVVEGARLAAIERIVVCSGRPVDVEEVRTSGLSYVLLVATSRRSRKHEAIAEAIDAADDLAGDVRLELDLSRRDAWAALRLAPP